MNRRKLIGGLGLLIAAPAIVKASNIMKVKAWAENPCAGVLVGIHGYHYCPGHHYKVGDLIMMYHNPTSEIRYAELQQITFVDDRGFTSHRPQMPEVNWIQL
jgi:predicted small secreted protein